MILDIYSYKKVSIIVMKSVQSIFFASFQVVFLHFLLYYCQKSYFHLSCSYFWIVESHYSQMIPHFQNITITKQFVIYIISFIYIDFLSTCIVIRNKIILTGIRVGS